MACGAAPAYRTGIGPSVTVAVTRGLERPSSFSGPLASWDGIDLAAALAAAYAHRSYQPLCRICKSKVARWRAAPANCVNLRLFIYELNEAAAWRLVRRHSFQRADQYVLSS